jgi:hypothetical protein
MYKGRLSGNEKETLVGGENLIQGNEENARPGRKEARASEGERKPGF